MYWYWRDVQEQAFKKLKQCLVTAPILAIYDPNKELKVNADAFSYGIGLLQKQNINDWKPVSYVPRALTDTETRYSQIEKECLALILHGLVKDLVIIF